MNSVPSASPERAANVDRARRLTGAATELARLVLVHSGIAHQLNRGDISADEAERYFLTSAAPETEWRKVIDAMRALEAKKAQGLAP